MLFHKVKDVAPLPGMQLTVQFANGATKVYDVKPLMGRFPVFRALQDEGLFASVEVDQGGYGIVWNDEIDLSCDELWEHGVEVATPLRRPHVVRRRERAVGPERIDPAQGRVVRQDRCWGGRAQVWQTVGRVA